MSPAPKSTAIFKRALYLAISALLAMPGARAQMRFGILGGLHTSTINETNNLPGWDSAVKRYQTGRSGFQLGVMGEMPLTHLLTFQPALLYTTRGQQYAKNNDSAHINSTDTVYDKQNLNLNYIDFQLNLGLKLPLDAKRKVHKNYLFVSAGPYIGMYYGGSSTRQTLTTTPPADTAFNYTTSSFHPTIGHGQNTYRTTDLGVNFRAGFEFGNLMLSYYTSMGMTNVYTASYPGTFHHQLSGFAVGLWFGKPIPQPPARLKDTDKDGIPDKVDRCPHQPGTARYHGCPVPDTDKDGVDDDHDSCRTVPGVARYNGCPIPDRDHDGVNDEEDKCPNQPGVARYQGCPVPDKDGDGINDEEDKCPDEPGPIENHGCPVIKKEVVEQINYTAKNILFTFASDRLLKSSHAGLNDLAGLLKAHPEWHLTIEGHTDNNGTQERNLILSQKRANAVKAWLVKQGVPETRLTATGYGQERPIADNATEKGRAANRRVELKVSLEKQ